MRIKYPYIGAFLVALGLLLPSFIVGLLGLIVLSIGWPFIGIIAGFFLDIVFGAPGWLPSYVAYPFTIFATGLSIGSIALSKYLR